MSNKSITEPSLGITANVETTVSESNTAKTVGSGNLDVYATPMLIALMEQAACACLEGALADGQTSVGTHIAVEHTAASPIGAKITATAVISAINGRQIEFDVTARDTSGDIGAGTHTRVIVDAERFMTRVLSKL